jgi:aspartyl-tRNA(Asn)/glutamyl-tRNA(Gln) amidotransferase subunit A
MPHGFVIGATIAQIRELIGQKKISLEELRAELLSHIAHHEPRIGALLEVFDDAHISTRGPLSGIPGVVKDVICQKGRITSCASRMLASYKAPYDATVIARLAQAGGYSLGRANCDEFAMGSSTETSAFKKTANPWDLSRVPGGSSGGSAAAVAAGYVPWALGSETGGSVRQPAAWCGVVGLKPSYGRISRYGLIAYGSSLDQVSIFGRSVADVAEILECTAGFDPADSTSAEAAVPSYTKALTHASLKGVRIGVITNAFAVSGFDPRVKKLLEDASAQLALLGAQLVDITLPTMDDGAAVYFMISRAEAASNLARFDGVRYGLRIEKDTLGQQYSATRGVGFGPEVRRRILIGNYVLSAGHADEYYLSACKVRTAMKAEFTQALEAVDCLFAPISPIPAFTFGAFDTDRLAMDLQDYFTAPVNLVGLPAVAVPCGFVNDRLPMGFQLIGKMFGEEQILSYAHAYEQSTAWHTKRPF